MPVPGSSEDVAASCARGRHDRCDHRQCPLCDHGYHAGQRCGERALCEGPYCFEEHPCVCSHPDAANFETETSA